MGVAEEGVGEIRGAYVHRAFLLNFNVFVGVGICFCWRVLSVGALTILCGVHQNRQAWPLMFPHSQIFNASMYSSAIVLHREFPFLTGRDYCIQSLQLFLYFIPSKNPVI